MPKVYKNDQTYLTETTENYVAKVADHPESEVWFKAASTWLDTLDTHVPVWRSADLQAAVGRLRDAVQRPEPELDLGEIAA